MPSSRSRSPILPGKVYVGDLGNDAREGDLQSAFQPYGSIKNIWIARRPPGFAFVEYDDPRNAEDAVNAMDRSTLFGRKIRCQLSHGKSRWPNGKPPAYLLSRPAPRFIPTPPRSTTDVRDGGRADRSHSDDYDSGDSGRSSNCSRDSDYARRRTRSRSLSPHSRRRVYGVGGGGHRRRSSDGGDSTIHHSSSSSHSSSFSSSFSRRHQSDSSSGSSNYHSPSSQRRRSGSSKKSPKRHRHTDSERKRRRIKHESRHPRSHRSSSPHGRKRPHYQSVKPGGESNKTPDDRIRRKSISVSSLAMSKVVKPCRRESSSSSHTDCTRQHSTVTTVISDTKKRSSGEINKENNHYGKEKSSVWASKSLARSFGLKCHDRDRNKKKPSSSYPSSSSSSSSESSESDDDPVKLVQNTIKMSRSQPVPIITA